MESAISIARDAVETARVRVSDVREKVSRVSANYDSVAQDYDTASEKYERISEKYNALSAAYNANSAVYSEKSVKYQEANGEVSLAQSRVSSYESQLDSVNAQIESNAASTDNAESTVAKWSGELSDAQAAYERAYANYVQVMKNAASHQAFNSREGAEYNVAMNNYTTELSARRNLDDTVIQLTAQVTAEQDSLNTQNAALKAQFESAKASALEQLTREIENYDKQIQERTVHSTLDGRVTAVNVMKGSYLQQAMAVCKVESGAGDEIICYISVSEGRKIQNGDKVIVYPSTYNRQEYGHMEGTVTSVSDEPATALDMGTQLGDDSLVQMFQQSGPVLAVSCRLELDDSTESGYKWSNRKGRKEAVIHQGTLVSADVIIDEKAPITMVIPYIKEKMADFGKSKEQSSG